MTKERPDAEFERLPSIADTLAVTHPNEGLLFSLAFAIDDPCGVAELELAGALIELGRAVSESQRRELAAVLRKFAVEFPVDKVLPTCADFAALLDSCYAVDARLPPAPWVADIDDPDTQPVFTGKFDHPPIPHTALCLYDEPAAAADLATLRNLFHELLEVSK